MEHKEDKKRNEGGRPKKGAIGKMTYHVAVKMAVGERTLRPCAQALRHGEQSQSACTQGKCRSVGFPEEVSGEVVVEHEVFDFALSAAEATQISYRKPEP